LWGVAISAIGFPIYDYKEKRIRIDSIILVLVGSQVIVAMFGDK
jgi:hypothetical protein